METVAPEYATFITATIAKEKGFDPFITPNGCYWDIKEENIHTNIWYCVPELAHVIYAPTQAELQKWIRETVNIHIEIYSNASGWGWILTKLNGTGLNEITDDMFFETYEDALEAGLLQGLNHNKVL